MSNTKFQILIYDEGNFKSMNEIIISKKLIAVSFVLLLTAASMIIIPISGDSSADSAITVTDGRGREVTFDSVAMHVITCGKGASATVVHLGQLDKLVVCDTYTKNATEELFNDLKQKIDKGEIMADGNVYSSGIGALKSNIIDAADTEKGGKFDKENDLILLTASKATNDSLYTYLTDPAQGYKKVLIWDSITDYAQIVNYATAISKALTGSVNDKVKSMELVQNTISDKLKEEKVTEDAKVKSIYISSYSSGTYKLGNTGSLAVSMMNAAGANNIAFDDAKDKPTYAAVKSDLTTIRESNTGKIVVFIDSYVSEAGIADIEDAMGKENMTYVKLENLWNNFSIDSKDGLWMMACAMYPEYFSGDVPEVKSDDKGDIVLYAAIGGAVAVAVLIVAVFLMKRH